MKHVLIMDDNVLLAYEWADAFELNGHQVTVTHNGEDAVALLPVHRRGSRNSARRASRGVTAG